MSKQGLSNKFLYGMSGVLGLFCLVLYGLGVRWTPNTAPSRVEVKVYQTYSLKPGHYLAASKADFDEMMRLVVAKDEAGLRQMILQNRVMISEGGRVYIQGFDGLAVKARMENGNQSFYLNRESLTN